MSAGDQAPLDDADIDAIVLDDQPYVETVIDDCYQQSDEQRPPADVDEDWADPGLDSEVEQASDNSPDRSSVGLAQPDYGSDAEQETSHDYVNDDQDIIDDNTTQVTLPGVTAPDDSAEQAVSDDADSEEPYVTDSAPVGPNSGVASATIAFSDDAESAADVTDSGIELDDAYQQSDAPPAPASADDEQWETPDADSEVELTTDSRPVVADVAQLSSASQEDWLDEPDPAPLEVEDTYQQSDNAGAGPPLAFNSDGAELIDEEVDDDIIDHFTNYDQVQLVEDPWSDWDEPYVDDGVLDNEQNTSTVAVLPGLEPEESFFDWEEPYVESGEPHDDSQLINVAPAPQDAAIDDPWSDFDEPYAEDGFVDDVAIVDPAPAAFDDTWSDWDDFYVEDGTPDGESANAFDSGLALEDASLEWAVDDQDSEEPYAFGGLGGIDSDLPSDDANDWPADDYVDEGAVDDYQPAGIISSYEESWSDWDELYVDDGAPDSDALQDASSAFDDAWSDWDELYVDDGTDDHGQSVGVIPQAFEDGWDWSETQTDEQDATLYDDYQLVNALPVQSVQVYDDSTEWEVQDQADGWEEEFALQPFVLPIPMNFSDVIWLRAPSADDPWNRGALPFGIYYQRVGDILWYGIVWDDWLANLWEPNTAATVGLTIRPSYPNGYQYVCTGAGQTGAQEPTWPAFLGAQILDGSAIWTCEAIDSTSLEGNVTSANWTTVAGVQLDDVAIVGNSTLVLIDTTQATAGTDYDVICTMTTTVGQQKLGKIRLKVQ